MSRQASTNANESRTQLDRSKSQAKNRHESPRSSGYTPTEISPRRWAASTSSVSGRYWRNFAFAFDQPPFTAGDHPAFPEPDSHRVAYTSDRPANRDANRATFSAFEDPSPS